MDGNSGDWGHTEVSDPHKPFHIPEPSVHDSGVFAGGKPRMDFNH